MQKLLINNDILHIAYNYKQYLIRVVILLETNSTPYSIFVSYFQYSSFSQEQIKSIYKFPLVQTKFWDHVPTLSISFQASHHLKGEHVFVMYPCSIQMIHTLYIYTYTYILISLNNWCAITLYKSSGCAVECASRIHWLHCKWNFV